MNIILPKTKIEPERIRGPLFFLAGPIKGGGNWQEKMCNEISKSLLGATFIVPCRWNENNNLYDFRMKGTDHIFPNQTEWEHFYLELAAERSKQRRGGIIFCLPCEDRNNPRSDGQPYARDSYGEVGAWRRNLALDPSIKLFVQADPDFPGLEVIRRNFKLDLKLKDENEYPIYHSFDSLACAVRDWVNGH